MLALRPARGSDMRRFVLSIATVVAACSLASAPTQFDRVAADEVAHGKRIAVVLGCTGCHGDDLTGKDWSDPEFGTMHSANLTLVANRYAAAELEESIRSGRRPGGRELWEMPSFLFTQLTKSDMDALIAFLRSSKPSGKVWPEPVFYAAAKQEMAEGKFVSSATEARKLRDAWPPDVGPEHALGRYIVRATCAECHGMDLRGGTPFEGATPRADLKIVAAYDLPAFRHLLTTGKPPGGRELELMSGVARSRYSHLTERERDSVYLYLLAVAGTRTD